MSPSNTPHSSSDPDVHEAVVTEISPETQDMVDRKLPNAEADVKRAALNLVDAIKKRAKAQARSTGRWTRETYLEAAQQAKDLLSKRQELSQKYKGQLDESFKWIEEEANTRWDSLSSEAEVWGDRLTRAADSAWQILTGTADPDPEEPDSASTCPKQCATAQKRAMSAYSALSQGLQEDEDQESEEPDSASIPPGRCATAQQRALSVYGTVNQAMQDETNQG